MFKLKFNTGYCFFILIFCIGLFFRLKLYFLNLSFHCDEANLALNLISRSYPELFLPLERLQVAPPFFLVLSKIFYQFAFFNFTPRVSDLMLRLIPLVSGIAAIPAFGFKGFLKINLLLLPECLYSRLRRLRFFIHVFLNSIQQNFWFQFLH